MMREHLNGGKKMTKYKYKLSRMEGSSIKYGPCEVCGKNVSDVYYQIESRYTDRGRWTFSGCYNLFGHEDCLVSKRRCNHDR